MGAGNRRDRWGRYIGGSDPKGPMTDRATPTDAESTRLGRQLAGHPFVQGLPPADIAVLAELALPADCEPNEILFRTGEPADRFFLIRSGVVSLTVDAGEPVPRTIELISEGSALGWSWLFDPQVWQFDAVAKTPVRGIAFEAAALRDHCEANPDFGYRLVLRMAEVIARRLHATRRQVLNLSR